MQKINFIENNEIKHNHFNEPKDDNPNSFKLYLSCAFIGSPHSGKTQVALNLAKYLQNKNLVTEIFIISPTLENNPFHILNIDDDHKISDLSDIENVMDCLIDYCKDKVEKWKEIKKNYSKKEYDKLYKEIYNLYLYNQKHNEIEIDDELKLTDEDYEILEDNKFSKIPTYYDCGPSFLLIFDDINGSKIVSDKKLNPLVKIMSNHRHNHINLILITQNYLKSIPS